MSLIRSLLIGLLAWTAVAVVPAQAQFADQATYVPATGGSANAQTATIPNVLSLSDLLGVTIRVKPSFTNTSALTFNINGIGAQPVNKTSSAGPIALVGSEFVSSPNAQTVGMMWDGARFLILSDVNSSPSSIFPAPQGYLTPCSVSVAVTGCTVPGMLPTGDVTAATTMYYRPGPNGNQIPIYNGSAMTTYQFSELTLTLGGSNVANAAYDVCVTTVSGGAYNVNGTPFVVTSVAWTSAGAGTGNRSTGAGTAQIVQTNGIWTNAVSIDGRNGGTTITGIPANRCTIVGSLLIDGSAGQVTFHRTWGQSRKWSAWNFYNRQQLYLKAGDATSSWTYNTTNVIRPSNNNSANNLTVFSGLPEEPYDIRFDQFIILAPNGTLQANYGIGYNVTNAFSGTRGAIFGNGLASNGTGNGSSAVGQFTAPPSLGPNIVYSLEVTTTNSGGQVQPQGTESQMLLSAFWRG